MAQIIPVKELKDTSKIMEMCCSTDEPIYITVNGYGKAVLMNMQAYEEEIAQMKVFIETMKGIEENGELVDSKKVFNDLRTKYAR